MTSGNYDPKWGFPLLDRIQSFPADKVNPPLGTKTIQWIDSSFSLQ